MYLRYFTELVLLILFSVSVIGAPIAIDKQDLCHGHHISGRGTKRPSDKAPPPTTEVMKPQLTINVGTSLFYSGLDQGVSLKQVRKWADDHGGGYKILADSWKSEQWREAQLAKTAKTKKKSFWNNASEAMAQLSSGRVYVILPPGVGVHTDDYPKSTWSDFEWPALKSNSRVTSVIRIDPDGKNPVSIKPRLPHADHPTKDRQKPQEDKDPAHASSKHEEKPKSLFVEVWTWKT